MPFWVSFLMWFATTIIGELLRPKPDLEDARPAGLGDFNFPTAQEGRPVPIVWGKVRLRGPNVVWYGDLQTEAITEKVKTGLFSSETVTTGYQYFIGMQLVLAHGELDAITKIWSGDILLWSGNRTTETDIEVNEPAFFGGDEVGGTGGFIGDFEVRLGSNTQAVVSYLTPFQNEQNAVTVSTPAYRNVAYLTLKRGYIGNTPRIEPLNVEVERYPTSLWDDTGVSAAGDDQIGDDANPVAVLYELLTNTDFGIARGPADVYGGSTKSDADSFLKAAEEVATESLGFSMIIDRNEETKKVIEEILRLVDGVVFRDPTTNQLKIRLIRQLASASGLTTLDDSNVVEVTNYTRADWSETSNSVIIPFEDRESEYTERHALAQDLANEQIQQKVVPVQIRFPGIKNRDVANAIAWRELKAQALPRAQGTLICNRISGDFSPGTAFELTWPKLGITSLICRVSQVRPGTVNDGRVKIDFVEDLFALENAAFAAPQPTGWEPPVTNPQAALRERLWEVPYQLAPSNGKYVAALCTPDGGLHQGFEIWLDEDGGTSYALSVTTTEFTPSGLLQGAFARDLGDVDPYLGDFTVDNVEVSTVEDLAALSATTIESGQALPTLVLIDDELIWFESATDNMDGSVTFTNAHRGVFDTVPADHADNSVVWFIGQALPLTTSVGTIISTAAGNDLTAKFLPFTRRGTLVIGSASQLTLEIINRYLGAIPPGGPRINSNLIVDDDGWTETAGRLAIEWYGRNKFTQDFDVDQDDAHIETPSTVGANIRVKRVDTDAVVFQRNATPTAGGGGLLNVVDFIPQTTPGEPDELDFYVEIESTSNSVLSQSQTSKHFSVVG